MTNHKNSFVNRIAAGTIKYRWALVICVLVVTMAALGQIPQLQSDTSAEIWFKESDPNLQTYRTFKEKFGKDQVIIIGIFANNIFTTEFLATLHELVGELERNKYVSKVVSLANYKVIEKHKREIRIVPLVRFDESNGSIGPEQIERLRETASVSPMAKSLVGEGSEATAVYVFLKEDTDTEQESELVVALGQILEDFEISTKYEAHVVGTPVVNMAMNVRSDADMKKTTPAAIVLVLVSTFVLFRRVTATLIPLTVVIIASIWTLGYMATMGYKMTLFGGPLILVILVVGVADSIHVLAACYRQRATGTEWPDSIQHGLAAVITPCFFTSLTTIVGFASLMTSSLQPIKEYGLLTALGAFFAFLLSVTFVPALLRISKSPSVDSFHRQRHGIVSRLLDLLGRPTRRSAMLTLAATLLILLPSIAAIIFWTDVTANPMSYFPKDDPIRTSAEKVDRELTGTATLELLVETTTDGLLDKRNLMKLDQLQRWLVDQPEVAQAVSIVDVIKENERALNGQFAFPKRSPYLVIRKMAQVAGEEAVSGNEIPQQELGSFVQPVNIHEAESDQPAWARVAVRLKMTQADSFVEKIPQFDRLVYELFGMEKQNDTSRNNDKRGPAPMKVVETGYIKLMSSMQDYLIDSQIKSLSVAAIAITVMMCLLLRSISLGLLSMIPNLVPIALGMAVMAVFGVHLDIGTVMIATVALGLVVDDSCHFLVHLRHASKGFDDIRQSIFETMHATGRPIVLTSVILVCGFLTLSAGSFAPTFYFGVFTALIIFLAMVADLVVLPACLVLMNSARRKPRSAE